MKVSARGPGAISKPGREEPVVDLRLAEHTVAQSGRQLESEWSKAHRHEKRPADIPDDNTVTFPATRIAANR